MTAEYLASYGLTPTFIYAYSAMFVFACLLLMFREKV